MERKDCFAYDKLRKNCSALNALYCKKEYSKHCPFYKEKEKVKK